LAGVFDNVHSFPCFQPDEIEIGEYSAEITSSKYGYVTGVSNKLITNIAKEAGAPKDKKAGVLLHAKTGNKVEKGDALYTIYSSSEERLNAAVNLARRTYPVRVEGMLLKRISRF